jgi:hypothetical protein
MAEIPEHLLKRSASAARRSACPSRRGGRGRAPAPTRRGRSRRGRGAAAEAAAAAAARRGRRGRRDASGAKIPPTCSSAQAPPARRGWRATRGGAAAAARRPATATAARRRRPTATGPSGHTQRLLTVVKSGSIQADPRRRRRTRAHLAAPAGRRVRRLLIVTAALTIFSALGARPLLGLADFNKTPNPSKAPWYFLGLQELLTMFHPMVAGVTIPGMGCSC